MFYPFTLIGYSFLPVYLFLIVKEILDGGAVINIEYGLVNAIPHRCKRTVAAKRAVTRGYTGSAALGSHRFIHKSENISHTDFIRRSGQGISSIKTAFGFHQTAAFELAENDLQKSQRDGLNLGDFGDFLGALAPVLGQFKDSPQGILIFFWV